MEDVPIRTSQKAQSDIIKCLSNQQAKTQKYLVYNDTMKQRLRQKLFLYDMKYSVLNKQ